MSRENINTLKHWNDFFGSDQFGRRRCWRTKPYKNIVKKLNFSQFENLTIYDIGCAFGDGLHLLQGVAPKNKYVGIDFSDVCIAYAQKKKNIKFEVGDIETINIKDADIIIVSETLEHMDDDKAIVERLSRMCGMLIISVPYNENANKLHWEHVHSYTEKTFDKFNVDCIERTFDLGRYLLVVYRMREL